MLVPGGGAQLHAPLLLAQQPLKPPWLISAADPHAPVTGFG